MISPAHVQLMARYNRWQNSSIYAAAHTLSDAQRREMRGAFWGSIHRTLTHILWADQNWMGRFTGKPAPALPVAQPWPKSPKESVSLNYAWDELKEHRLAFDRIIIAWAASLPQEWLNGSLTWTNSVGVQRTQQHWMLATHFFNHQTHHRGQMHCLLTELGAKPEDTDIPWMPAEVPGA